MATNSSYQKSRSRYNKGFAPVTAHLNVTRKRIGGKRGFHDQKILTHWSELVGDEIATIAQPYQLKRLRSGRTVLVIDCLSAYASEMRMRSEEIILRLNAQLGVAAIERVEIRHQHLGFAEERARYQPAPARAPQIDKTPATLRQEITKTENDSLREALSALSYSFYRRHPSDEK